MFRGTYKLMKVELLGDDKIRISRLTPKEAADPATNVGAVIDLSSGCDQLIVIDDDVYKVGTTLTAIGFWGKKIESTVVSVQKAPPEMADMIIGWLKVQEKKGHAI
jgi:hypothetical protein